MAIFRCFSIMNDTKVKKKAGKEKSLKESFDTLIFKLQHSVSSESRDSEPTTFDHTTTNGFQKNLRSDVRVLRLESLVKVKVGNSPSIKRELLDFDLQSDEPVANKEGYDPKEKNQVGNELEGYDPKEKNQVGDELEGYDPKEKNQVGDDELEGYDPKEKNQVSDDELEGYDPKEKNQVSDDELEGYDPKEKNQVGDELEGYDPKEKNQVGDELEDQREGNNRKSDDTNHSGHVNDPGVGKSDILGSTMLKRTCSNLESKDVRRQINEYLSLSKSLSFENFRDLWTNQMVNLKRSRSLKSDSSANRVLLKRHSSSQVLPSGSKKLWWKLLLWSQRNIHKTFSRNLKFVPAISSLRDQLGYSSDTLEPKQLKAMKHVQSSVSFTTQSIRNIIDDDDQRQNRFRNQWLAFTTKSSSYARVDAWVKDLEIQEPVPEDGLLDYSTRSISFPSFPDAGRPMIGSASQLTDPNSNLSKDILKANSMVQSLNPASSVAHISGVGIKAIPVVSHFSNLRSVNLSNNFLVSITPGCLPKSVQTLNLSRNKISTIDGLKELIRLRVLDISYNCISRIGQGLSSCTLIKELYLAGNKINDIDGLHRLFKLTVLDLSFNKITTTKSLGQLVSNYNSLQALNLTGNAIQRNIGNEQLNKSVSGLLPNLVFLNKQPLNFKRAAQNVFIKSVDNAALRNSRKRSSGRRSMNRVGQLREGSGVTSKSRNGTRRGLGGEIQADSCL